MKDLAMRWLAGWSAATGHPWTEQDGIVRVETLTESRRIEYVLVEPSPAELSTLTDRIDGDPRDVVTIFTIEPATYLAPLRGLTIDRDDEVLMTRTLSPSVASLPQGYDALWDDDETRVNLSIVKGTELAAGGNLAIVGQDAIFDRIETMPRFQRRGLGSILMHSLTSWALDHGAETGILSASADGQELYQRLGWSTECAMIMLRGAPTPD